MRFLLLTLLPLPLPLHMSAQSHESPAQAAVAAVFAAEDEGDVATLVALIHPDAMAAFKQRQLDHDAMFDQGLAAMAAMSDSATPEARAMGAELHKPRKTLLQAVFKVRDRGEFERLTPVSMEASSPSIHLSRESRRFDVSVRLVMQERD